VPCLPEGMLYLERVLFSKQHMRFRTLRCFSPIVVISNSYKMADGGKVCCRAVSRLDVAFRAREVSWVNLALIQCAELFPSAGGMVKLKGYQVFAA
jgi:hypothetical protein